MRHLFIAIAFTITAILDTSCSITRTTAIQPFLSPDYLWVAQHNNSSRLGKVNLSTGAIEWHQLNAEFSDSHTFKQSVDGRYIAVRMSHGIAIYETNNKAASNNSFNKVADIGNYENPQWSPISNELLLLPIMGTTAVIWKPDDGNLPSEKIAASQRVCSATWGLDADTIVLSTCTGERELMLWSRKTISARTWLRFNLKVSEEHFAVFADIQQLSPSRQLILLKLFLAKQDLPNGSPLPSTLVDIVYAVGNIRTGEIRVFNNAVFSGSSFAIFVSNDQVLSAGTYDLSLPVKFNYMLTSVAKNHVQSLWPLDQNCLQEVVMLRESPVFQYRNCNNSILEGFYEVDIQRGQRRHIPIQDNEGNLILIRP